MCTSVLLLLVLSPTTKILTDISNQCQRCRCYPSRTYPTTRQSFWFNLSFILSVSLSRLGKVLKYCSVPALTYGERTVPQPLGAANNSLYKFKNEIIKFNVKVSELHQSRYTRPCVWISTYHSDTRLSLIVMLKHDVYQQRIHI